jgi:hypothetical protein
MLIFALLISCASIPGSLALDDAGPLATCSPDAEAFDLLCCAPVMTAYDSGRHPDRRSLPAGEWPECADDQEGGEDSGDEDGQTPSLADLLWLLSSEVRVSPHLERPTRSVPVPKRLSVLRC